MLHEETFLTIYILVVAGIFGAVFGSFINCMAWRTAHGESVWKGRSHCAVCGHRLKAGDLVPVFSYLFLRGRCRYCKEKISPRYMGTELLMACVFVSLVWRYDVTFEALRYVGLACILLGVSLVDLEIYEIPNGYILAGILWWLATMPFAGASIVSQLKSGLPAGFLIAGSILLVALIFEKITGKDSLGGGDIKLLFVTGLYLGIWKGLFQLITACVLGLVLAVGLKKNRIPFGPAIAAAVWVTLLVGEAVIGWYLGLII